MKRASVVIILLFAPSLFADPDLSGIIRLTTSGGLAHACPVSMDKAFTNRHVTDASNEWVWGIGDGEGVHGLAEAVSSDSWRDLAVIRPVSAARFPKWYPIAKSAPAVGSKIWFVGYDWANRKKAFAPVVFDGKVTQVYNGQIAFDSPGEGGSSGSCILNEVGEVVAINKGGKEMDDKQESGVGVGIWGDWLSLKRDEPVAEVVSE